MGRSLKIETSFLIEACFLWKWINILKINTKTNSKRLLIKNSNQL
jgi:hypothetical protein